MVISIFISIIISSNISYMIIYKTTNLTNNKFYIGQDSKNNPNYYGSGIILIKAIKKYGKENFKKEILEFCITKNELDNREKYWIEYYNSTDKNIGYNIHSGGGGSLGGPLSDEHRKKISNATKGKYVSPETRKKLSDRVFTNSHKEKISKNHIDVSGTNSPMYGKEHSETAKRKISEKNLGNKHSELTKLNMSQKRKGENNSKAKLTEKDVLLIRELWFTTNISQIDIAMEFNVKRPCINKILNYKTWNHI